MVHAPHLPHPTTQPRQGQKKDQLIFNAAKRPHMDAIPVNLMTSTNQGTELDCTFRTVMTDFPTHTWNLRNSFPKRDITIHANNVKLFFCQLKHHPDVMGAFSFVINTILFLQCSLMFGSDFSLANWEPVRSIAEQLAIALFNNHTIQDKHKHHLNKLQWDNSLGSCKRHYFTPATWDSRNPGEHLTNGSI